VSSKLDIIRAKAEDLANQADPLAAMAKQNQGLHEYNVWYSACLAFIEANLRSRLPELQLLHNGDKTTVGIGDHIAGRRGDPLLRFNLAAEGVLQIKAIIASVPLYLQTKLHDIELVVADTMTRDLLTEAENLLQAGYVRSAGALAGVMVERHLKMLCDRQTPPIGYPDKATISKLNDLLKAASVYDAVEWRKVQVMGDIRNGCDHARTDEPRPEDVRDLIAEARKFIALHVI
jgi:hypothetical protein